ncbi:LytTR family transcriptional regulator [Aquimarina sp. BL5]|uniref:LytR/AlgR family response regulator transcription factor n=1 Tax=Aquimarina sp. BL5 TaxID=1714860 RepID=UPI000E4DEEEC|nr:LytTR family transcriptional regulator DNA-binding domain-containing protein [Aquimarina sp. BL5]AXT50333.1 LytTR family transcriptional regulator [Aquimarina sp. BL5]RKM92114.1 LytTR family transcriptional regulator [Aquimarina sp. BL5]
METIINSFKNHINFSNFWIRNGAIVIILSILVNHLFEPKYFPFHRDYKFPLFPIVVSIIAGSVILIIARFNFNYFRNKYFTKKINSQILVRFLFSTLGYITILYLFLYFGLNGLINGTESYSVYNLLTGLSISLLISAIGIALLFSTDIYKLHKLISIKGTLKVRQGGAITLVKYPEIAFIYSENKIVYIVKTDGTRVITDFTLNEVESKINEQIFYRANRQIILHARSIEQVKSIENGKLSVLLKPTISDEKSFQINISRYKRPAFMNWFESKL